MPKPNPRHALPLTKYASQHAMQLVTRVMAKQTDKPLHSKQIWDLVRKAYPNAVLRDPIFPPVKTAPTEPLHVVRSMAYLKRQILSSLEIHGRVKKVKMERPPETPEELEVLAKAKKRLDGRNKKKVAKGQEATSIIPQTVKTWGYILQPPLEGKVPLEDRWDQFVADKVKKAEDQRLKHITTAWGVTLRNKPKLHPLANVENPWLVPDTHTTDKGKERQKKKEYDHERMGQLKDRSTPKALLMGQGRNAGIHYGLPKHTKLMKMANERTQDQKPWSYQPKADWSHMNTRRQRTREDNVREDARKARELREAALL